jgi:hypothetical protein
MAHKKKAHKKEMKGKKKEEKQHMEMEAKMGAHKAKCK